MPKKEDAIMADNFQVGDSVKLKSGSGPVMMIESLDVERQGSTTDGARCVWFEKVKGKQEKQKEWFPLTLLKKLDLNQESGFYAAPAHSILD
jgi:uncharacterized protein YodC (DUF2158 family)